MAVEKRFAIDRVSYTDPPCLPANAPARSLIWRHESKIDLELVVRGHKDERVELEVRTGKDVIFTRLLGGKYTRGAQFVPQVAYDHTKLLFRYTWPQQDRPAVKDPELQERFQVRLDDPRFITSAVDFLRAYCNILDRRRKEGPPSSSQIPQRLRPVDESLTQDSQPPLRRRSPDAGIDPPISKRPRSDEGRDVGTRRSNDRYDGGESRTPSGPIHHDQPIDSMKILKDKLSRGYLKPTTATPPSVSDTSSIVGPISGRGSDTPSDRTITLAQDYSKPTWAGLPPLSPPTRTGSVSPTSSIGYIKWNTRKADDATPSSSPDSIETERPAKEDPRALISLNSPLIPAFTGCLQANHTQASLNIHHVDLMNVQMSPPPLSEEEDIEEAEMGLDLDAKFPPLSADPGSAGGEDDWLDGDEPGMSASSQWAHSYGNSQSPTSQHSASGGAMPPLSQEAFHDDLRRFHDHQLSLSQPRLPLMPPGQGMYDLDSADLVTIVGDVLRERGFEALVGWERIDQLSIADPHLQCEGVAAILSRHQGAQEPQYAQPRMLQYVPSQSPHLPQLRALDFAVPPSARDVSAWATQQGYLQESDYQQEYEYRSSLQSYHDNDFEDEMNRM